MRRILGVCMVVCLCMALGGHVWAATLLVDDFNQGEKPNALGGDYGSWNKDEADPTQSCVNSYDRPNAYGAVGFALRLDYDVDSPNAAYNGFWMKLQGIDTSDYKNMVLYVKGDSARGFSKQVKLELKNKDEVGNYLLKGITKDWQRVSIPLAAFSGLKDLSAMTEFVIVFDDLNTDPKVGTVYFDEISFEN